jgi:nitrogen PTS system EIIA component
MQLSVADAAYLLCSTEEDVRGWIEGKRLPAHQVGDILRLNRAEVLEWAVAHGIPVSMEGTGATGEEEALPSLAAALRAGGVHGGIRGRDGREVLRSAVAALPLPESFDREALLAVLLARESRGSTGIGDGIAIPHVRNPIVVPLGGPMVALFFLDAPVDFRSVDGRPVHTLFLIASPTVRMHQHLLARLSTALGNPGVRGMLAGRDEPGRIIDAVGRVEESFTAPRARGTP